MYVMTRTQIYLTERESKAVDKLAKQTNRSKSDIIRHALDIYLGLGDAALDKRHAAFGVWATRKSKIDSLKLQSDLRKEWDR